MRSDLFIGLDIGTSGARAVLYRTSGEEIATTHNPYPLATPHPGWAEQDPEVIWKQAERTLAELSARIPTGGKIAAIGVSSIFHALLATDAAGCPVTPSIIWADLRARAQVEELRRRLDARAVYESTGCPLHPMYLPGKILWLRQVQPDRFQRVAIFGSIKDEILYRLTGQRVQDKSVATASGLYDLNQNDWSAMLLDAVGIRRAQLPEVIEPTDSAGGLRSDVAARVGLPAGTPVIAGAGDGVLSSLGAGAVAPGQMTVMIGTSGAARLPSDRPIFDRQGRTWCYYLAKNRWIAGAAINNGGLALEWVREKLWPGSDEAVGEFDFENLVRDAEKAPPGAGGLIFLPFLTGERSPFWNADARGVLFGLAQHLGSAHVARSAFEGVCYRMRSIVDALDETAGPTGEVRATGGFVRSAFWLQLLSDVLGRPLRLPQASQASAFGAAGLAMLGTGALERLEDVAQLITVAAGPTPSPEQQQVYQRVYRLYLDIYWANQKQFADIAALQEELGA